MLRFKVLADITPESRLLADGELPEDHDKTWCVKDWEDWEVDFLLEDEDGINLFNFHITIMVMEIEAYGGDIKTAKWEVVEHAIV